LPPGTEPEPENEVAPPAGNNPNPLLAMCDLAVTRALEYVGKRNFRGDRSRYKELASLPPWQLHTVQKVPEEKVDQLLTGAWDAFKTVAPAYARYVPAMNTYVRTILTHGVAHESRWITDVIALAEGDGQRAI